MKAIVPVEIIERKIFLIRGQKVMLDSDLADMYDVAIKVLLQAIKRNANRFPADFMFQLSSHETEALRSQIVTLKRGRGQHRKYLPYVFAEHSVAMLSSVLKSERAIEVNIAIMRAFIKLREMIGPHKDLAKRLDELEKKYDMQFKVVFDAIRQLVRQPEPKEKKIGFIVKERGAKYRTTRSAR